MRTHKIPIYYILQGQYIFPYIKNIAGLDTLRLSIFELVQGEIKLPPFGRGIKVDL